jgi:hypothetical protein
MRSRVPAPAPESSEKNLVDSLEYALTAALVIVVIVALLEIFGVDLGTRF